MPKKRPLKVAICPVFSDFKVFSKSLRKVAADWGGESRPSVMQWMKTSLIFLLVGKRDQAFEVIDVAVYPAG